MMMNDSKAQTNYTDAGLVDAKSQLTIEFQQTGYCYPDGTQALSDLSFAINNGEKIVMLGANGAGKSTLFMLLTGLLQPTSGQMRLCGQPFPAKGKALREARKRIGLVFQNPEDQLFAMTVEQEVAFGAINLGLSMKIVQQRTAKALQAVDADDLAARPLHHLSFGQKKRISIADLLVMDVDLLLLDEPTAWLDPANAENLTNLLDTLHSRGCGLLCSTHDVNWAYHWADRLLLLEQGHLIYDGPMQAGLADDALIRRACLQQPLLLSVTRLLKERGLVAEQALPRYLNDLAWELDRLDHHIIRSGRNDSKRLRMGYTTGSCAAGAASGAVEMLLTGRAITQVAIPLPSGLILNLTLLDKKIAANGSASCAIRKDAGDDPDATHGLLIYAEAAFSDQPGLELVGGLGIGKVTRAGLPVAVGEAAINPGPCKQIETAVQSVVDKLDRSGAGGSMKGKGLRITLSIPQGEQVASRTYNPRLGIVGGLSVLGTTGLVSPMSEEAWQQSLYAELKVVQATGARSVVFAFGQYGLNYLQAQGGHDPRTVVIISNFVGFMLEKAVDLEFAEVLLVGHIGKMIKVSAGIFQTHSHVADARLETLTALAGLAGADRAILGQLFECPTTEAAVQCLRNNHLETVFQMAADQAARKASQHVHRQLKVRTWFFDSQGELLAQSRLEDHTDA